MKQEGYQIRNQFAKHFLTFQVIDWVDIFTRKIYRDIILESFEFCRREKELSINGYVIMSNHVHTIMQSKIGDLSNTIASIKKYTGLKIIRSIDVETESRKDWMLKRFEFAARSNRRSEDHQFWTHENQPKEIITGDFFRQKLYYIHNNPIKAGIVEEPEHYLYSSARNYAGLPSLIQIDVVDL